MNNQELKDCPLCGGKARITLDGGCQHFRVFCSSCGLVLTDFYSLDDKKVIKRWNKRINIIMEEKTESLSLLKEVSEYQLKLLELQLENEKLFKDVDIFFKEFKALQDVVLKQKENIEEAKKEEYERIMRINQTWTLVNIIKKLSEATRILLHEKNYDGHGYEEMRICLIIAENEYKPKEN